MAVILHLVEMVVVRVGIVVGVMMGDDCGLKLKKRGQ